MVTASRVACADGEGERRRGGQPPACAAAAALLGLVVACDAEGPRRAERAAPPATAADDEGPAAAGDAATVGHAELPAPPRETWPCGFDVVEDQGDFHERGRVLFTYGARERCTLPYTLVPEGIYGCPEKLTRTDSDGMVRVRTFEYDAGGRLTAFLGGNIDQRFGWEGDRLATLRRAQLAGEDVATFGPAGRELLARDAEGRPQLRLAFAGGRLRALTEYIHGMAAGEATVAWSGDRPRSVRVEVRGPIRGAVTRTFVYDCAATPTRRPPIPPRRP